MASWKQILEDPRYQALDKFQQERVQAKYVRAVHEIEGVPLEEKQQLLQAVHPPEEQPWAAKSRGLDYTEGVLRGLARHTPVSGAMNLDTMLARELEAPTRPSPTFERGYGPKIAEGATGGIAELLSLVAASGALRAGLKAPAIATMGERVGRTALPYMSEAGSGALAGAMTQGTPLEKLKQSAKYAAIFPAFTAAGEGIGALRRGSMRNVWKNTALDVGRVSPEAKALFKGPSMESANRLQTTQYPLPRDPVTGKMMPGTKIEGWFKSPKAADIVAGMKPAVRTAPKNLVEHVRQGLLNNRAVEDVTEEIIGMGVSKRWAKQVVDFTTKELKSRGIQPATLGGVQQKILSDAENLSKYLTEKYKKHDEKSLRTLAVKTIETIKNAEIEMAREGNVGQIKQKATQDVLKYLDDVVSKGLIPEKSKEKLVADLSAQVEVGLSRFGRTTIAEASPVAKATTKPVGRVVRKYPTRPNTEGLPTKQALMEEHLAAVQAGREMAQEELPAGWEVNPALHKNVSDIDVEGIAKVFTSTPDEQVAKHTRSAMNFEEIKYLADQVGLPAREMAKKLFRSQPGSIWNVERYTAAVNTLKDLRYDFTAKATTYQLKPTEKSLAKAYESLQTFEHVYAHIKNLREEGGRLLGAMRSTGPATFDWGSQKIFKNDKDLSQARQIMAMLAELSPEQTTDFISKEPTKIKLHERLYSIWINSLLTNPTTHEVNFISNLLTLGTRTGFEAPVRAAYDWMAQVASTVGAGLKGQKTLRQRTYFMRPALMGTVSAIKEVPNAWTAFKQVLKNPELARAEFGKAGEGVRMINVLGEGTFGTAAEKFMPGNILTAADKFFKTIARRTTMVRMAGDQALREGGVTGATNYAQRVSEILASPTEAMLEAAEHEAQYVTFTNPLGRWGKNVLRMRNDHPALKFVVPFVRTPTNIAKYGLERIPGVGSLFEATKKEGLGAFSPEVLARQTLGGMLGLTAVSWAMNNQMTGSGPVDPQHRAIWYKMGYQPYSFIVNGKSYSYNRFEPIASVFGFASDLAEGYRDGRISDERYKYLATKLSISTRNLILNKTYTRGITDLIEAMQDPERKLEGFVQNMVGTFLPASALMGATTRAIDPTVREITDPIRKPWQILQAKTPIPSLFDPNTTWLSENLPPMLDNFGDPIIRPGSGLSRLLSPSPGKPLKIEPWLLELQKHGIGLGKGKRGTGVGKLTEEEYQTLMGSQGTYVKSLLNRLVEQPHYQNASLEAQYRMIRYFIRKARERGRLETYSKMSPGRRFEVIKGKSSAGQPSAGHTTF